MNNHLAIMYIVPCRGAIAFALAIRNAASGTQKANIFLTTTIILVVLTVIGCGALTLFMLQWLKIRYDNSIATNCRFITLSPLLIPIGLLDTTHRFNPLHNKYLSHQFFEFFCTLS